MQRHALGQVIPVDEELLLVQLVYQFGSALQLGCICVQCFGTAPGTWCQDRPPVLRSGPAPGSLVTAA
jgi:hypothetical protein